MTRSLAFLVGVDKFADTSFQPLRFCQNDVSDMDRVLLNREISDFETIVVRNEEHYSILKRLEQAVYHLSNSDKVIFYFAGHGKLSRRSGLPYLVASDTISDALNSTGIAVDAILRILRESNCRQRLMILDCCHSGAVGEIFRGNEVGDSIVNLARSTGTYILTASTAIQTAAEREHDLGDGGNGVFTRFLVEGIETGEAQVRDGDENITVDDLFDYVRSKVIMSSAQEPKKYVLDGAGTFNIARSRAAKWDHRRREIFQRFASMLRENVISQDELSIVLDFTRRKWVELDGKERDDCRRLLQVLDGDGAFSVVNFFASVGRPTQASRISDRVIESLAPPPAQIESYSEVAIVPLDAMFANASSEGVIKSSRGQLWVVLLASIISIIVGWVVRSVDFGGIARSLDWSPANFEFVIAQIVTFSEWIISASLLFAISWVRFNSPPTNRSGTTFALFFFGVIFYYSVIITAWLIVAIFISQGSIGLSYFGNIGITGGLTQIEQYKPIFAVLIIVVASQFPAVNRIDGAARSFCVSLAAIPREADRLALELAQTGFLPKSKELQEQIAKFISENVGSKALKFAWESTLEARFTRTVGLYCLFIVPKTYGTKLAFPAGAHARSAYAEIMQFSESIATRAEEGYEELMQAGLEYFGSGRPTKEAKDRLSRRIADESNLICSLIARYVLYSNVTRRGRYQQLSDMGFNPIARGL
jgi:hypothetical protein